MRRIGIETRGDRAANLAWTQRYFLTTDGELKTLFFLKWSLAAKSKIGHFQQKSGNPLFFFFFGLLDKTGTVQALCVCRSAGCVWHTLPTHTQRTQAVRKHRGRMLGFESLSHTLHTRTLSLLVDSGCVRGPCGAKRCLPT